MKKGTILFITLLLTGWVWTQQISETVSTGAGQVNQTWYSLENGEQGSVVANNWDIAFNVSSSFGTSIRINSEYGAKLWVYPNGDNSDWTSVDTSGINQWNPVYNSDTSWFQGAFDVTADPNDGFDVGWGIYDVVTHDISGDSVHIVELTDGSFRKLKVESLISGVYSFTYANIDGTNEVSATVDKGNFMNKLFGYYSLVDETVRDREPVSMNDWDLLFSKQTAFIPVAYPVASILLNPALTAAQETGVADPSSYSDYQSANFVTPINTIGYDWKSFNGQGYDIETDRVYFVKNENDEVWKIIPTGFGGNANGNFEFDLEKLATATLGEESAPQLTFSLYPNPADQGELNVIAESKGSSPFTTTICTTSGKEVASFVRNPGNGLVQHKLDINHLDSGVYIVRVAAGNEMKTKKLIINQ